MCETTTNDLLLPPSGHLFSIFHSTSFFRCSRGVKLIFTRDHISLVVAFKRPNIILGLYKCNYSSTRGKELSAAIRQKQGARPDKTRWRARFGLWALCLPPVMQRVTLMLEDVCLHGNRLLTPSCCSSVPTWGRGGEAVLDLLCNSTLVAVWHLLPGLKLCKGRVFFYFVYFSNFYAQYIVGSQ